MAFLPTQSDAGVSGQPPTAPGLDPQVAKPGAPSIIQSQSPFSDAQLLAKFETWKKESFDQRWIFEREWQRNVWYLLGRQWITYNRDRNQWQDKRLAKWVPKPVTNILKDAVQAVRANFAAINYGTNARPLGDETVNVITAGVADNYAPILHEDHKMDAVMNEFDFWMLATGNAFLHTCVDYDRKNGIVQIQSQLCAGCGQEYTDTQIADAGQKCPNCGSTQFLPSGKPPQEIPLAKGITLPLSPFEIAFPLMYERFDLAPYVIRMRWRDKTYYEQTDGLQDYGKTLNFSKSPADQTMRIFKTLPFQNDMSSTAGSMGSGGANTDSEGVVEYDVWIKPCVDFPDGYVLRVAGDKSPVVIHREDQESLPGPLPYHDAKGNPIFTFFHGRYESVGGRALGSSLISPAIQKQDQLNQLDSHALMVIGRMANPIWLEPKGAEVEKFTGEPGLVVKWNPLVAGGQAKPERIPGEGINASVFQYREMIKAEAEELLGTNDLLKGQKPAGVEAFAALNLLVERGQAKHTSAFQERGAAYKGWFKSALEIEREFGPSERIKATMGRNRQWAFETFKKADLSGNIEVIIEDGTLTPKTSLGERASIEHLRQLGLLNPSDPDQVMAIYEKFGQQDLLPGLDAQVQEAGMNMDRFEKFINKDPEVVGRVQQQMQMAQQETAMTGQPSTMNVGPLVYKRWYNPQIHRQELIKWALSDRGRAAFQASPMAETYVDSYLATIDMAISQAAMGMQDPNGQPMPAPMGPGSMTPGAQGVGGGGMAMANSNRNAAGVGPQASGAAGAKAQAQGPVGGVGPNAGAPTDQASNVRAIRFLEKQ